MIFYRIIKAILRVFTALCFRIRVVTPENVPLEGAAVMALNHRSNWDVIVALARSPRKLHFMAKHELFKNKLFASVLTAMGAFPVHRGKGDIGAIKAALARLHAGDMIAMFPEGPRVREGQTASVKPGAVMLAIKGKAPIVPVCISGKYGFRSKITLTFGQPIYYDDLYGEKVPVEQLQELSNGMMRTLRTLGTRTDGDKV